MRVISRIRIFLILSTALFSVQATYEKVNYTHHSLYIYNFSKYIQWTNVEKAMVIGVSGGNPEIIEAFEKMAFAKSTPEFQYIIRKVQSPTDAAACHILYIPEQESAKLATYAIRSEGNQLIVTEGKDMLKRGGMINFVIIDKKLRFEINQKVLEKGGLKVSNQLVLMAVQ